MTKIQNVSFKKIFSLNEGFSLIELLLTLAIMAVLGAVGAVNLSAFSQERALLSQGEKVVVVIRDVQDRAVAEESASAWGIKITNNASGSDQYETFYGASYAAGTVDDIFYLPTGLALAAPAAGSNTEIVFAKGTGAPNATATIDMETATGSRSYRININAAGMVEGIKSGKNLAGYWKFDEGSGTTALDSSGYNRNGTVSGATVNQTGQVGKAYSFGGDGDNVNLGDRYNYTSDNFTYAFWIKLNSLAAQTVPLYKGRYEVDGWYANVETTGITRIVTNTSGNATSVSSGAGAITTGTWYHIVGVKNGSSSKIYVNGAEAGSGTLQNPTSTSDDFLIGSYRAGALPVSGLMDDVRIWNRALSEAEVGDLYNDTK